MKNKELGLLHPAIDEFYSKPENIEKQFPPGRRPSSKARYVLMYGLMKESEIFMVIPDYYFIAPLEGGDFSEIRVTDLDSVLNGVKMYDKGVSESFIKYQWKNLEKFDSLFLGKIDLIPPKYPAYAKTPIRKPKTHRTRS